MLWFVGLVVLLIVFRVYLRYNIATCSPADMTGKVVIITGANTGIGYHTAKALAAKGARVILACRNEDRGTEAAKRITQETGNSDVVYKHLDLASLTSVRKFSEEIAMTETKLDVLVNNAGIYGSGDRYSEDGILEVMQVNLFAPLLLTNLLLPLLKQSRPSRIVNVSSIIFLLGEIKVQKLNKPGCYGNLLQYSNSKLGSLVWTAELARRLRGQGVCVTACHPGVVDTGIVKQKILGLLFSFLCWICKRSASEASATPVHLSACAGARSGAFYVDCARWPAPRARAARAAGDLWAAAETLMNCTLGNMTDPTETQ